MILRAFSFLKDNIGTVALGVAAAACLTLSIALSAANDRVRVVQAELKATSAKLEAQNTSIALYKRLSDERKEAADKALALATEAAVIHETKATTILQQPVPTKDAECAATLALLAANQ